MPRENEIVFEDLHGSPKDETVTIDLDAGSKDDGITRTPAEQAADADAGNDDDIQIDGLRTADDDAVVRADDDDDASRAGEDDEKYSKKVKARIQRATRATRKEKDRGDYWEHEARKLAKDGYDNEKRTAEGIIERADSQLEDTQTQLEQAIEDGNTKDQVRLTTQLTDQKAARVRAEVALENLPTDGNVQPYSGKVAGKKSGDQETKADDWMDGHSDWYGARGFERQTRLANRIDKEVFDDGFLPDTDEYFKELDKRIKEKEPKLFDDSDDADDAQEDRDDKRPARSPVAPVGGAENRRQSASSSKVQLTEDDFANMRRFNLDPNDPEVLKEYARNKREVDAGERR